eukprot:5186220-Pleurochrysis_carterae.AAC.1
MSILRTCRTLVRALEAQAREAGDHRRFHSQPVKLTMICKPNKCASRMPRECSLPKARPCCSQSHPVI